MSSCAVLLGSAAQEPEALQPRMVLPYTVSSQCSQATALQLALILVVLPTWTGSQSLLQEQPAPASLSIAVLSMSTTTCRKLAAADQSGVWGCL